MTSVQKSLTGCLVALVSTAGVVHAACPIRSHLSLATAGLVLVIPVVAGVAVGGLAAGVFAVVLGFFAYDLLFIPPYNALTVGTAQNWVALIVYALVMLVVAHIVVVVLQHTRAQAKRREDDTRRVYDARTC